MKYTNKYMMVPIDPNQEYLNKIDAKLSKISKARIKPDQKVKLYNQSLDNFLLNSNDDQQISEIKDEKKTDFNQERLLNEISKLISKPEQESQLLDKITKIIKNPTQRPLPLKAKRLSSKSKFVTQLPALEVGDFEEFQQPSKRKKVTRSLLPTSNVSYEPPPAPYKNRVRNVLNKADLDQSLSNLTEQFEKSMNMSFIPEINYITNEKQKENPFAIQK